MQTHEWEALLDGTTPGPWEWVGYDIESSDDTVQDAVMEIRCETSFGMSGATRNVEITPEDEALIAALARILEGEEDVTLTAGH